MIDGIITLVMWLMFNSQTTRNHFQTKSCDQVDDLTNQLDLSRSIPMQVWTLYHVWNWKKWKHLKKIIRGSEKFWFVHVQMLPTFNLGVPKCFEENSLTLWKFQENISSHSGDIKIFCQGLGEPPFPPSISLSCQRKV